jgi:hypothetical protein
LNSVDLIGLFKMFDKNVFVSTYFTYLSRLHEVHKLNYV